jgi:tetratricopeptide (TPR) repeat protein
MIKQNFIFSKNVVFFLIFNTLIIPSLFAQNNTEITLTIDAIPTTETSLQFNSAEKLRKEFKFAEAIQEYENVINSKEETVLKPEATYNIGLCYTWLNNFESADYYFKKVINEHKNNLLAVSFANYGLAWLKVQEKKYYEAIEILENELNKNECNDYEHNAVMLFQLGKIYQKYILDFNKAEDIYKNLIASYPKAKIISHPFLSHLTN